MKVPGHLGTPGTVASFGRRGTQAAGLNWGPTTWSGLSLALGTHYRANEGAFGMMSKYLLFSHTQSSSSVSATNSQ